MKKKKSRKTHRRNNFLRWWGLFLSMLFLLSYSTLGQSAYTIDVRIPPYDSTNPEHFLISSSSDWSHINDPDKRFFYVKPHANYGRISVYADGTADSRRYISLYNGNDIHPAQLTKEQQANVRFVFNGAHYWVVDRMSSIDFSEYNDGYCVEINNNSGNIIFNRLYFENFFTGIIFRGTDNPPYTHDMIIQNSRMESMSSTGIDGDAVAIMLMGHTWNTPGRVKNIKILNNEIRNCNDGIMLIKMPQFVDNGSYYVDYPGTIIDHNFIYVDSAVYTDGNGNHDPNDKWALTENAIDLKGGSDNPDLPIIISNNYYWGYRRTDQHGGGSGSWGTALVAHYHVKNLLIKNHILRVFRFSGI